MRSVLRAIVRHRGVQATAILEKIHVHEGEFVQKGRVLATLSNLDLESETEAAKAELTVQEQIVQEYRKQLADPHHPWNNLASQPDQGSQ